MRSLHGQGAFHCTLAGMVVAGIASKTCHTTRLRSKVLWRPHPHLLRRSSVKHITQGSAGPRWLSTKCWVLSAEWLTGRPAQLPPAPHMAPGGPPSFPWEPLEDLALCAVVRCLHTGGASQRPCQLSPNWLAWPGRGGLRPLSMLWLRLSTYPGRQSSLGLHGVAVIMAGRCGSTACGLLLQFRHFPYCQHHCVLHGPGWM